MTTSNRMLLGFLFVTALFSGCSHTVQPDEGEAHLELGSGSWRFEPLEDGAPVALVRGAQGGWHVWVSVRADGIDSDDVVLEIESQVADESRPAQRTAVDVRLDRADADGRRAFVGWPQVIADPGCMVGELLRLKVALTDSSGTRVVAERYVTVMGGDDPPGGCGE